MNHLAIARGPLLSAALALVVAVASAAAVAAPVPLDALFGRPEFGTVELSPSGRWLAATMPSRVPGRERLELLVADLDHPPLQFKNLAWLKDYDIGRVEWLNDKRLVFTAFDSQAGEWAGETGLWAADVDGDDNRMLIDPFWVGFRAVQPLSRQILSAEWAFHGLAGDGGDDVLVLRRGWSSFRGRLTYGLFRLNTHEPRPRRLDENAPEGAFDWLLDASGQVRWLQAEQDGRRDVYRRDGEGWRQQASFDLLQNEGWAPHELVDGQLLVTGEPKGATGSQVFLWDEASAGPAGNPVLRAPGFDLGQAQALFDGPQRRPIGWRFRLDGPYTRWTDDTMAAAQAAIDRALPGRFNEIHCGRCLDATRWLVLSRSDRRPPGYFLFERSSGRLVPLGATHPDVPEAGLGARSFHRIRARDGSDLPLYLTRPVEDAAAPKPERRAAVVYVHGGPAARNTLEWNHDAVPQFLASRGYVVIEPEFRGSVGYGSRHARAGDGQWGLAMQADLHDALRWAVEQGFVDERRVCIMGASYGGYAALMGPATHPADYRCAVAWVAPTDLARLLNDAPDTWRMSRLVRQTVGRMIGPDPAPRSPLKRVAEIKVPVLAAWGEDDRRVPLVHGRDFRDAARAAGVALEYVEYPHEGHVWLQPATRLDFFSRAERLLQRSLVLPAAGGADAR